MSHLKQQLTQEAKRLEEDCRFAEKQHLIAAVWWKRAHYFIGGPTTVFAAAATVGAFAAWPTWFSGSLVLVVTVLSALAMFLNPREHADLHHSKGTRYNALVTKARQFYQIDVETAKSEDELVASVKGISGAKIALNTEPPPAPSGWIYDKARESLQAGEASYAVDEEKRL